MRLGIDVGGTHTDAVIMVGQQVLAAHKARTSADISEGILRAARRVLEQSSMRANEVESVAIGTTQFTNAIVERRGLQKVAAIRIGAQSTAAVPPFMEWPEDLTAVVRGSRHLLNGGNEYDGSEILPLDDENLAATIARIAEDHTTSVAVCALFSPVAPALEDKVAMRVQATLPAVHVSKSHELGGLGLYQRENATLLNAALLPLAEKVIGGFADAFDALGISAPLYISQNDGTLMRGEVARRYPVLTFASGPTNSMRGAAFLSGIRDAMVVDVGGTTSDIGMLVRGFPRPSGTTVEVGGVQTNFRMPDVLAVGLGGGSRVKDDGSTIGPGSVGHELSTRALCFGGDVLTTTDIGVASGLIDLGDSTPVRCHARGRRRSAPPHRCLAGRWGGSNENQP